MITAQEIVILGYEFASPAAKYLLTLAIVAVLALLAKNMMRSETGRAFMAVRDMDVAAEVIGIRMMRTKLLAFAISSFYCGVAGALYAYTYLGTVEPEAFTLDLSFRVLFMVIIGGIGTVLGSFLGAAFITLLPDLPEPQLGVARLCPRHRDCARGGVEHRADHLRRPDHLLPHRRALRTGAALADRQGEAAAVAVPALAAAG